MACTDTMADVYTLPTLSAFDATKRGEVFHCAQGESLTAAKVNTQLTGYMSTAANATSGFWTYRIAFRSQRSKPTSGTAAEGDMAAVLMVPEKPLAGAPLVVWAHGSLGIAPKCAPSRFELAGPVLDQDTPVDLYKLAGYGFTVIAPDYSGYSYGQTPMYFNAEDEAHAVLDATRAAAKILPSPPSQVVFAGHSQGGHAVLAAHAYAKSYGMSGTLVGVAALTPLWFSMSTWGAITTPTGGFMTSKDVSLILYSMEYFYTAAELRDGPGAGLAVFQTAKQQAVKDTLLGDICYDQTKLQALGATPADFFDSNFVSDVGFDCAANPVAPDCTKGDAPKWLARWQEDRPTIDDQSAPILVYFGGKDGAIKPGYARCAIDKLNKDVSSGGATTKITACFDANQGHREIVRSTVADTVNQWIAARAGVGTDPPCDAFPMTQMCETPPNDW
jgi:pimeloyl-ACP methyl ester carboxylesterase